jgi:hypothetical protein
MNTQIENCDKCSEPLEPSQIGLCDGCQTKANVHTNDLGVAIRDALELLNDGLEVFDWSGGEPVMASHNQHDVLTDASDGFSNLKVDVGGSLFRISITRIG